MDQGMGGIDRLPSLLDKPMEIPVGVHHGLDEGIDQQRVKLSSAHPAEFPEGFFARHRPPVGLLAGHRIKGIDD